MQTNLGTESTGVLNVPKWVHQTPTRHIDYNKHVYEHDINKKFVFESKLGEIASQLIDSKIIRIYHDHMLTKEPGKKLGTPWHQDQIGFL